VTPANPPAGSSADREIVATRVFDAPRELVWKLWTDPHHVAQWWGPNGFTSTIQEMDVRPGGAWRLIMHGPDGTDYPNKSVYVEVVRPERLVYDHVSGPQFRATATFLEEGGKTRVTMRMVFESAALRDRVAKEFGAVEGLRQTLGRLGEQISRSGPASGEFVISRVFDLPREKMFELWTNRDHLMRWFGPKGFTMPEAKLDFRPGGMFLYHLRSPDGHDLWGKFAYREISQTERMVWVNSFSDENAGVTRHPFSGEWPLELLTTVTFADLRGKTLVTVRWSPLNPTPAERKTFDCGHGSMQMGSTGTFEQLAEYTAKAND
jgi:uncharacterized protein YndB with AHSA1/START domain